MQLWLILMIVVVGLMTAALIILGKGGGFFLDFTPIFRTFIMLLSAIAGLSLYISHLSGCLNQRIGVTEVTTMKHVITLPVECNPEEEICE